MMLSLGVLLPQQATRSLMPIPGPAPPDPVDAFVTKQGDLLVDDDGAAVVTERHRELP